MAEQKPEKSGSKRGRGGTGNGGMRFGRGLFGWVLFVALVVAFVYALRLGHPDYKPIAVNQFMKAVEDGKIATLTVTGDEIDGEFLEKQTLKLSPTGPQTEVLKFKTEYPASVTSQFELIKWIYDHGPKDKGTMFIKAENTNGFLMQLLSTGIFWIVLIVL